MCFMIVYTRDNENYGALELGTFVKESILNRIMRTDSLKNRDQRIDFARID